MKRTIRYSFLFMMALLVSLFINQNVIMAEEKVPTFWELVEDFNVEKQDVKNEQYYFDPSEDSLEINYKFNYDWQIRVNTPITDGDIKVYHFYGANVEETLKVEWFDDKGSLTDWYYDIFTLYKYNFTTNMFDKLMEGDTSSKGEVILSAGLYKLSTLDEKSSGINVSKYLLVMDNDSDFAMLNIEKAEMNTIIQNETPNITLNITGTISDPRALASNKCENVTIGDGSEHYKFKTCSIIPQKFENLNIPGKYNIVLEIIPDDHYNYQVEYTNTTIKIEIEYGKFSVGNVNVDFIAPSLKGDIKYYNKDLVLDDFSSVYDNGLVVSNRMISKFVLEDASGVDSVSLNGLQCQLLPVATGDDVIVVCSLENEADKTELKYVIADKLGNVKEIIHDNLTWDNELLPENLSLEEFIFFNENITILEANEHITNLCVFYGEELSGMSDCADNSVVSSYYYKGWITIVGMDEAYNILTMKKEVTYTQDFVESKTIEDDVFLFSNESNDIYSYIVNMGVEVENMYLVLNETKLDIIEEALPPTYEYLYILNNYFRDSTCAFMACDKEIRIDAYYKVGNVEQVITRKYEFKDNYATIMRSLNTNDISLEYGGFEITDENVIRALYADELQIDLEDRAGHNYRGTIKPVFVEYRNMNNEVTVLNNFEYTHIANNKNLGTYLLECRVLLLSKNGHSLDASAEDMYTKSFFINVNLQDTTKPVLVLMGESEIKVKQYDVYKDDGVQCSDLISCEVEIEYYLDSEDNKVENLDTSVVGKHIIKYVAKDSSGNITVVQRIVDVESVNSLDITSIVVISVVVVLFATFITVGIIREKKKKRGKVNIDE